MTLWILAHHPRFPRKGGSRPGDAARASPAAGDYARQGLKR